ncbi:MAG: PBP1A family penicillin-binding protein [Anaerovibrio sp.]|uniref:transglycosylase domain-containing protein n=1 Tax=Anaerovibrio sp. TaxID=1872532 RepID=UPI0025E7F649|nr:PBP1A family penicillin-binding protein [Anaerovibrio sp.]MCR5175737.1 PBP1A family penicillin-binding protein [Anaerovibrio sp.]
MVAFGSCCGFLLASANIPDDLPDIQPAFTSHIYDIKGNEIAVVHAEEDREPVTDDKIPANLKKAFLATEDVRFYEHIGIDYRGVMRAIWENITHHTVAEGGSTITQQLARNAYLTQDRTFKRKIQEMFLALKIEHRHTKDEILVMYLNQIYFGRGVYGVQAAAKYYFNKNVEDLNLNECAMLAGIPKSPNEYSPLNNLEESQKRKGVVLHQMAKYGYITLSTAQKTANEEIHLVQPVAKKVGGEHYFIDYVKQIIIEKYGDEGLYKGGLKIYTTIDMDMQQAAERAMQELPEMNEVNGVKQPQGALVAIDPQTGYIKAMVGGRGTDMFNRAALAERQPGSAFKPFVFAAALESGYTPDTTVADTPLKGYAWSPQNYDRSYNGNVPLRYVCEQSLNVATVKVAEDVGMDKVLKYARDMGISTLVMEGDKNDNNLAAALGGITRGVTPLELTGAYCTFANKGLYVKQTPVVKVMDRDGNVLEEYPNPNASKRLLKEETASQLDSMLQGVVSRGTGTRANIGGHVAGKTGTTSDYHDAWFVGYVPDLVVGVWVGCDNNQTMGTMTGGTLPADIWRIFMKGTGH